MSSTSLWKISNESSIGNLFKMRFKVSVTNSNLLRFRTFGHLPLISVYDTLANYPKLRFRSFGCLGRISFYYTLAIQELSFKTATEQSKMTAEALRLAPRYN